MTGNPSLHWPRRGLPAALAAILCLLAAACATPSGVSKSEFVALEQAMLSHINVLASDEFGGRKPGTDGERKTLAYIRSELERRGLESGTNDPANPWLAPVELARVVASEERVEFIVNERRVAVSSAEAFANTPLRRSLLDYAPLLFAGSTISAPSADAFVGQVVVLYGNDARSTSQRDAAFDGGAAAVLQIVPDEAMVETAREAFRTERFRLSDEMRDTLTVFMARDAFAKTIGIDLWQELESASSDTAVSPRELGVSARIEASSQSRALLSYNLIAKIPGTKPGSGALLLLGHWDHFGICGEEDATDRICNGAVDNASGIASLIELSDRLVRSGPHDRDIYVLATTAEEWGLLGAKAFVARPPLPLEEIVAAFNFDTVAVAPRDTPVAFLGQGYTNLDEPVLDAIARSGRGLGSQITADEFLRRQDGWALLEAGVPTLLLTSGLGDRAVLERFLETRYHKASDNPQGLELGGAIEDLLLHEDLVTELASATRFPVTGE